MPSWRRRACARDGISRRWPHTWSVCSPTASGCSSGRHSASGGIHRAIDELARRRAAMPAAQIAATLRQGADRELSPPITGPLSGLADVLVHGGDIRIPLGLPFDPDPQLAVSRARFSDRTATAGICAAQSTARDPPAGQPTSTDRWGEGAEVRGPVGALMMAACGRVALVHLLDGPGVPMLRDRLTAFRDRS